MHLIGTLESYYKKKKLNQSVKYVKKFLSFSPYNQTYDYV